MKKRKFKLSNLFLLSWKKTAIALIIFITSIILHNFIYGLGIYFGGENFWGANGDEAFFFIVAIIIIPSYFIISIIYTLIKKLIK